MSAFSLQLDPAAPEARPSIAAAFATFAGRRVRLTLRAGNEVREYEGRVARRDQWPADDDPFLLLRPGSTDRTHVLSYMALHFRVLDGHLCLARRRHYEEEPLDLSRLPAGPVELRLEVMDG